MRAVILIATTALLTSCSTPEGRARAQRIADTLGEAGESLQGVEQPPTAGLPANAVCMRRGDEVSGQNRICRYSCNGTAYAVNVPRSKFCPISP